MNTPIKIESVDEYINQINKITEPQKNYIYRGQENAEWLVNSSGYRRVLKEQPDAEQDIILDSFVLYLNKIIDEVQLKYPNTYKNLSPLECMAHLQHNKVATGLIDFTFNPLVALMFACENKEEKEGKVFVLENDKEKIEEITTRKKLKKELDEFFTMDQPQWYSWTPSLDSEVVDTQRMIIQQSVFLFGLPEITSSMQMQEIIIPHQYKEPIRTELENVAISEITLFSDLLGFFERNMHTHTYDLSHVIPRDGENQR